MRVRHARIRVLPFALLLCAGLFAWSVTSARAALPPIKHVFVIVLENESDAVSFPTTGTPPAPYLGTTMRAEGAYLPNYYGVGHNSLDNYIAMISGQAPNTDTRNDCPNLVDFPADSLEPDGQEDGVGCVYSPDVANLGTQLTSAADTWGAYEQSMGTNPAREASTCGHSPLGGPDGTETGESAAPYDEYAARHNPFMYFHDIVDNASYCNNHVVNLSLLPAALSSVATTPNYVFITPDLCGDGHDGNCHDPSRPGGFAGINQFLSTWVPQITASPAYQQDGLLLVTFDESAGDDTSCCGEVPGPTGVAPGGGGPGGGDVGAVLLSRYIAAGTVSATAYNHYNMLGSIEDMFGLGRLGYAAGTTAFGADVFTQPSGNPPAAITTPTPAVPAPSPPRRHHRPPRPARPWPCHIPPATRLRTSSSSTA